MTDAERKLWSLLRRRQLLGYKFRRQQPLGPYIVDFVCLENKLVIEVDGGQHAENKDDDACRTQWLEDKGFKVVRFWNHDVLMKPESLLQAITLALPPPPVPPNGGTTSPSGGEVNKLQKYEGNISQIAR
jgi:very-short-patch-repair endonuclease